MIIKSDDLKSKKIYVDNQYLPKSNKYNNTFTKYKNRNYHSRLEAEVAFELDQLLKKKEITKVIPQFTLRLEVNGKLICKYVSDFYVLTKNGQEQIWEAKGYFTDTAKFKYRLAQALFGDKYKFILRT